MEKKVIYRTLSWKNTTLVIPLFILSGFAIGGAIFSYEKSPETALYLLLGFGLLVSVLGIISRYTGVIITDEGITSFSPFFKNRHMKWSEIKAIRCVAFNQYMVKEIPLNKLKTSWFWGATTVYLLYTDIDILELKNFKKEYGLGFSYQKKVFEEIVLHLAHYFDPK